MSTSFRLIIPTQLLQAVYAHARAELPNECCGLLAGHIDAEGTAVVARCYPLVNETPGPSEYRTEGRGLLDAAKDMRKLGIRELALYHSHPISDPVPSPTDLANNTYGLSVMHLIVSLQSGTPEMRGWWLSEADYCEGSWQEQAAPNPS